MNIRSGRIASFIIIGFVYLLALAVGIGIYVSLTLPFWLSLLVADAISTAVVFIFSLLFKNASVYDPYWSVQPPIILILYFVFSEMTVIKILTVLVVLVWGIRLTANWAYTFFGLLHEDWRYTMLREKTGKAYFLINLIGIHMVPTLVVYAATIPAVFVVESSSGFSFLSVMALILSLFAIILQTSADIQMHRFRKRPNGSFIRNGLWRYSRHPNYLGEILMWWGIALSAVALLGFRWYLIIGAVSNTLLFLFVSIPLADGKQSKKEGFEEYKKQTRILIPIKK